MARGFAVMDGEAFGLVVIEIMAAVITLGAAAVAAGALTVWLVKRATRKR